MNWIQYLTTFESRIYSVFSQILLFMTTLHQVHGGYHGFPGVRLPPLIHIRLPAYLGRHQAGGHLAAVLHDHDHPCDHHPHNHRVPAASVPGQGHHGEVQVSRGSQVQATRQPPKQQFCQDSSAFCNNLISVHLRHTIHTQRWGSVIHLIRLFWFVYSN